jgi:hypothetical protein
VPIEDTVEPAALHLQENSSESQPDGASAGDTAGVAPSFRRNAFALHRAFESIRAHFPFDQIETSTQRKARFLTNFSCFIDLLHGSFLSISSENVRNKTISFKPPHLSKMQ